MDQFEGMRIKWPYVTHAIDRTRVCGLLPPVAEENPGAVLLARVLAAGRHKDLEAHDGRRMSIYVDDVFVAVLGNRYATDQFEGIARCSGDRGHILGIGGVCGEVTTMNNRMTEPTPIQWLGRLCGPTGEPLHLNAFRPAGEARPDTAHPVTVLSLGASMNSGKTTTAAQMIRSLTLAGHRVAGAKITGTACRKDPNLLYDAGAIEVLDFTHAGWPSTAGLDTAELLAAAARLRGALAQLEPEFVVIEIADGVVQRETALLLADTGFHDPIDAVVFAGPDALSCDAGVRRLRDLGYDVLATAGMVANSELGQHEAEAVTGIPCLSGERILGGALVAPIRKLRAARTGDLPARGRPAASRQRAAVTTGPAVRWPRLEGASTARSAWHA